MGADASLLVGERCPIPWKPLTPQLCFWLTTLVRTKG
ncbi:rCG26941 [Rattus norvegicus]|uniref:RCG26941 n=1 Tax=Rattus norvegicus TaxID=10116 RepID=A6HNN7_RAT|nr:rCG26941 [Rattus norvegicus]